MYKTKPSKYLTLFCFLLLVSLSNITLANPIQSEIHEYATLVDPDHTDKSAFIEAVRKTTLLSSTTSIARIFRYLYLKDHPELAEELGFPTIALPTENDWLEFQEKDVVYYAVTRAISFISEGNALERLLTLKQQQLLRGNKAAVAQVACVLAIYYFDFAKDSLNAIAELLYALPEVAPADNDVSDALIYNKAFVLYHLFSILYDLGAYEASFRYGQVYFEHIRQSPVYELESYDYFLMVMLANQLGKFDIAMSNADELLHKATSMSPSAELFALLAKVSVHARRNQPGDLDTAYALLDLVDLKSQPEDWSEVDQARLLAVKAIRFGLQGDMPATEENISSLRALMVSNPNAFNGVDFKYLSILEGFLAEFNHNSAIAIKTKLERLEIEHASLVNALNNRLDTLGHLMQSDIDLIRLESLKAKELANRQALETARLKSIILALIIALVSLVSAWLFIQRNKVRRLAHFDPLTGAPNRRYMFSLLNSVFSKTSSGNCIALIDIDYFKKVNDTYGHQTGDEVLIKCSDVIKSRLRKSDQYCRYGGEEFLLLLKDTNEADAKEVLDDIRDTLVQITQWNTTSQTFSVSFSSGLVELGPYQDLDDAISRCDELLYSAKNNGRGCTMLNDDRIFSSAAAV